jgi:hypothetical protein
MLLVRLLVVGFVLLIPSMASAQQAPASSGWVASAFAGADFGQDANGASLTVGGGLGYLWRGIGAEFVADFTPNFGLEPALTSRLFGQQPWINSYMFNVIGAAPLGAHGRFRPYVSAGAGALTLSADRLQSSDPKQNDNPPDDNQMGANVGGGLMAFRGNAGFRADVRYFRGYGAHPVAGAAYTIPDVIAGLVLHQLDFWSANVGLAFRW